MITVTLKSKASMKDAKSFKRQIQVFDSIDKAKKELVPIVAKARKGGDIEIDGVSFDLESEKTMLKEIGALKEGD